MAFVLTGGRIATGEGAFLADVRVEGEMIADAGRSVLRDGDEIVDVSGKILLPGGIDVHTHFGLTTGEDGRAVGGFAAGTKAALAGGTTCVVDYATQFAGETLGEGLANWRAMADGKCHCDYAFHLGITDWRPHLVKDLADVLAAGVTSFKMYMAYKGTLQVDDGVIYEALREFRGRGALLCAHCENGDVIAERVRGLLAAGLTGPMYHPVSRPDTIEAEATGRLIAIADLADAPVYVAHVSADKAMRRIAEAKREGQRVYAETCPQYLYLDDSLYAEGGGEAAKYVCSPPLRARENNHALWAALSRGLADVVATDHCPLGFAAHKAIGREDFSKIPNGMPGVGSRVLLMYRAVTCGLISLSQMVRLLSSNPARIFGMYPRKGAIVPGGDADIVVLDPDGHTTISASSRYNDVDYTPFEGFEIPASIDSVYLRGRKEIDGGKFLREAGDEPRGVFISRGPSGAEGV